MPSTRSVAMAATPPNVRNVSEVLLSATKISTIDRTSLSLWHFQQLTQSCFHTKDTGDETPVSDVDKENSPSNNEASTSTSLCYMHVQRMQVTEGMSVAAISYEPRSIDEVVIVDENSEESANTIIPRLTLASKVAIVYKRYRCVLCLDASPSIRSIDPSTGQLFLDLLVDTVEVRCSSII